jgi:hypothetical protein
MPPLSEIGYSREACIAAVRDYYAFLAKMYLNESDIIEPPEGGWPSVTTENFQGLGKSDEVIALLRHLPYLRLSENQAYPVEGAPDCKFADWQALAQHISLSLKNAEAARVMSEVVSFGNVPPHVIGLTRGGTKNLRFMVDTELGTIQWPERFSEIASTSTREEVYEDAYDYAPENEVEWRQEGRHMGYC